ncbi:PKD repeat protein [Pedobacter sp. UYP30]|uniref:PKD domain-containing protein n=1 Tax=Pedobacter sp. UYP30 TaxID=1756400 RepID=UPI00339A02A3
MTWIFGKLFRIVFLSTILLFFSIEGFSQLTIGPVDAGPYTPGGTIAATFKILSGSCIKQTNQFQLFLSDASGSFASEKLIGNYDSFYSTYINGIIPVGTPSGTGYKLRIKSTLPAIVSVESSPFEIKLGAAVQAKITSNYLNSNNKETFGTCQTKPNNTFILTNQSTPTSLVNSTIKDELNNTQVAFPFPTENQSFTADLTHYTIFVKATMPNGTVGTKAYLLINNKTTTVFGTSGSNTICLPDNLEFPVDTSFPNGIGANFPGNLYTVDWGDNTTSILTICEIISNNSILKHQYTKSSCGNVIITSNGSVYNVFGININLKNKFCGNIGTPVSTTAKVVRRPDNSFVNKSPNCANVNVLFQNTSDPGQNPNTNSAGCVDNDATYNWYVDGVLIKANQPKSYNFEYTFPKHGLYTVKLESTSNGACDADPEEHQICIQDLPKPVFTLPKTSFCAPSTLIPVDKSIIDNVCTDANTYNWVVTPAVSTINGTTLQSKQPEFSFTQPGVYQFILQITTPSCGLVSSAPQTVVVNTNPTAKLSPDITLCNLVSYDFNNTTTGPTKTLLTGTPNPEADTYTWTVTGGAYSFTTGDAHSQYPSIKFDDFATYTVKVVHKNGCGMVPASQILTFQKAPKVDAGPDQSICFTENSFSLDAKISDNTVAHVWVGGNGVFSPDRNALNATYTPTAQERAAGTVALILRATTALAAPCRTIDDEITLIIKPKLDLTSLATLSICTNETLNYEPTNNVAGTVFSWTATGSTNAAGFSASGSGLISDQLSNTDPINNAQVTYTIIPKYDGCEGTPFKLVVTVSPRPIVTATAAEPTICSNTNTNITLSSNLANTTYTYTSTVSGSVTGNTTRTVPSTVAFIKDKLVNTGSSNATVTYTIVPSVAGKCPAAAVTKVITVYPAVPIANAGKDMSLCSGDGIQLSGNEPGVGTGTWTLESGQSGVAIANPRLFNTAVTGLIPGQTYTFKWTIIGAAPCSESFDEVKITFFPPVTNTISSADILICNGTMATILGDVPTGGAGGPFTFSWEESIDNGGTWNIISGQKSKDLTINLSQSTQIRRLVNSSICTSFSNVIDVKVRPPLDNNIISANQEVCFDKPLSPLQGSIPTGGDGNYGYQWQKSTDQGATWVDIASAKNQYLDILGTAINTWFRRLVTSAACGAAESLSNVVKITIIQPAKAEFTFGTAKGCSPFLLEAMNIKANSYPSNDIYTWYADDVVIGTGLAFPGYTITGGNRTVTIKLVTSSKNACNIDTFEQIFSTYDVLQASFTQDLTEGCGPLKVTFKNTSAPLTDATFKWDFGNGQKSTVADPGTIVFDADATGKDTTYTITLTASTPCNTIVKTSTVMVKAKAIAVFSPDRTSACSPATINFSNTSPGNTNTYYFDFGDGTTSGPITDKSSVSHVYTTTMVKDYVVTMRAENNCGSASSSYTVTISPNTIVPELVVNSNEKQGCAPLSVNLYNNTSGANIFTYTFLNNTTGEKSTTVTTKAPEVVNHIFTTGGNYTVTLVATNGCSTATTTETITVYDKPVLNFAADKTDGCDGLKVTFNNTAEDGVGYLWDFGDGQTSTDNSPTHVYNGVGKRFTVTLTATNQLGCPTTATLPNYITLVSPPVADFTVKPGNSIAIPNYTFSFFDNSSEGAVWEWDFGDGVTSKLQNPVHLYPDTGTYRVNLKVYNKGGCASTTYQTVRIIGVPGFLYLPNSFMPGSAKEELRTFKAKGRGVEQYKLSIFNKWGLLIFETSDISDGAPSLGWDGTYNGVAQPQGAYFWKAEVKFTNGSAWKGMTYKGEKARKTGVIYLIR